MKKTIKMMAVVILAMALASCADSVTFKEAATRSSVGFLHGFWHGLISPFSWFMSLFSNDVAIYAIYNNGGWNAPRLSAASVHPNGFASRREHLDLALDPAPDYSGVAASAGAAREARGRAFPVSGAKAQSE